MTAWIAITVSVFALAWTLASFWWMNWRNGTLHTYSPRTFAARGDTEGPLIVRLPLVLFNDGPMPLVVQNLKLVLADEPDRAPLHFVATMPNVKPLDHSIEQRDFAAAIPVSGRDAIRQTYEFQRRPGRRTFDVETVPVELHGVVERRPPVRRTALGLKTVADWELLLTFDLVVTDEAAKSINTSLITHDNMPLG